MLSCFVLWSGGLDSTYLIIKLLEAGYIVNAGYVEIQNNAGKSDAEKQALEKLVPKVQKLFPDQFHYHDKIYEAQNCILGRGLKFKQVPYFIHALLIAPWTDYRALGYVSGDSAIKHLENIRAVYNSYAPLYNGKLPTLAFPIKNVSKQQIALYMKSEYASILKKCWWCERPSFTGLSKKTCGTCTPCKRMSTISL